MSSVLFREAPPAVDALIEERRRTGVDRFDEVWEGVYVVNPPPSYRHSTIAGLVLGLLEPHAVARGLVARREVGVGRADDHRIPDIVVADVANLDDRGHHLLSAHVAVEILSPSGRVDKRPFYLEHGVAEVVLVDPSSGEVEWFAAGAGRAAYEPVQASAVLPSAPATSPPCSKPEPTRAGGQTRKRSRGPQGGGPRHGGVRPVARRRGQGHGVRAEAMKAQNCSLATTQAPSMRTTSPSWSPYASLPAKLTS